MFDSVIKEVPPVETIVVNQSVKTERMTLRGSFSTNDNSYKFDLKSDGTGEIYYSDFPDDAEDFFHEIDFGKLTFEIEEAIKGEIAYQNEKSVLDEEEIQNIHQETTSEILAEKFWDEINQTLDDPFFRSSYEDISGEEFQTANGTIEEFTEFLKLSVLTERESKEADDYLIVYAETEIDAAGLNDDSCYTERLTELVKIGCEYYQPMGFYYDYNDGCYDRMSGYSMSSDYISVSFNDFACIPTREKMLGMKRLRKKLIQMNVPAEKIALLTSF